MKTDKEIKYFYSMSPFTITKLKKADIGFYLTAFPPIFYAFY